jgi:lipoate-protein ligase A
MSALRVLDFGSVSPVMSLAIWHGIADAMVAADEPVMTLSNPDAPYICVGFHQDVAQEVDEAWCAAQGMPVIRREAGGGAVLLDAPHLFVHFIYPRRLASGRAAALYPRFIAPLVETYRALGVAAEYRALNDIHADGRKIGGSAIAAIGEAVVFAGMILFDFDAERMARALRVPSEKFRDKLRASLADYVTSLRRELGAPPSRERVIDVLLGQLPRTLGVDPARSVARADEREAIERRAVSLLAPDWTRKPGRRLVADGVKLMAGAALVEVDHKAPGGLLRLRALARDGALVDLDIAGDFTCLPIDGPARLAAALRGTRLDPPDLAARIDRHIATLGLDMPGVGGGDIAAALIGAVPEWAARAPASSAP